MAKAALGGKAVASAFLTRYFGFMRQLFILFCILLPAALRAEVSEETLAQMRVADVVILGEVHDNPLHHLGQAEVIAALRPRAVVFEMLTPTQALEVRAFEGDDLSDLGGMIGWEAAGWPAFEMYLPIFQALGEAQIIGMGTDRAKVRAAFAEGAAASFGARALDFGLTQAVPKAQHSQRMHLQFDAHCQAMPMEMMGGMVEAQRYRDAVFAETTLRALGQYGAPVVVLTGHGHARRDWAVPYMMAQADPSVVIYSFGFLEAPMEIGDPRFDHVMVTGSVERSDPCAAFVNE